MPHSIDTINPRRYGSSATACRFPVLLDDSEIPHSFELAETPIELPSYQEIMGFCEKGDVSLKAIMQAAWAVVLKTFTGSGYVCAAAMSDTSSGIFSISIDKNTKIDALLKSMPMESMSTALGNIDSLEADVPCNSAVWMFNETKNAQWEPKFDVWLHVDSGKPSPRAALFYRTSHLNQGYAEIVSATVGQIVMEILANPFSEVSQINLVHPRLRNQLQAWSSNSPKSIDRCVGALFEEAVSKYPLRQAIQTSERSVSYEELNALSAGIALRLQSLGVVPESIVVLCFPKSVYAVIAMLAVVRAGGTILFLDPSHPETRHKDIVGQANSQLILTAQEYSGKWGWFGGRVLPVDPALVDTLKVDQKTFTRQSITTATPSNALYIIFTSGSTGKPKGCVVEHRQFLTGAIAQQKASEMNYGDKVLQLASFTFDVSVLEILTSLITGACVCIPNDEERSKGPERCIQQFGITWTFLTPSLVKLMSPKMVPSLKFLVLGGEAVQPENIQTWAPHVRLANGYGPTECSIAATANPRLSSTSSHTNIGYPLGGCCWIVDKDDHEKLLPIGAPGELLIQGPIVARGYLNEKQKTEAVFLNSTSWAAVEPSSSSRIYKTGDLARFNFDGSISFSGRKDNQVKLRGLRIELGEVEHHLMSHELAGQVVVVLPTEGPCQGSLTAVISLKNFKQMSTDVELIDDLELSAAKAELEGIASSLRERLPGYMHPTIWIPVKSIPLTSSGKLNGVAVRQWVSAISTDIFNRATGKYEGSEICRTLPSNNQERQLQEVCSKIIGLDQPEDVWLEKSFIQNGGDSIQAMQLLSTLRDNGLVVKLEDIIQLPTILLLARKIENREAGCIEGAQLTPELPDCTVNEERVVQLGLEMGQVEDIYPLSPVQRGILLAQQHYPDKYQFRLTCEVVLLPASSSSSQNPEVDIDNVGRAEVERHWTDCGTCANVSLLVRAWRQVVQLHPVLRTIFIDTETETEDGLFDQLVLKTGDGLADIWQFEDENEFWRNLDEYKRTDGPLQPPVAFIVSSVKAERRIFCTIDISHALIDGISSLVLLRDICQAYGGLLDSTKTVKYSPFIRYLQQLPRGASLSYWTEHLLGVVPCYFPTLNDDFSGGENQPREIVTNIKNTDALHRFCAAHNFTPATVFQAAWALTLRAYTRRDDVCFGYLTSGRDLPVPNIHNAVGVFVNMMIYRASLSPDKVVSAVLTEVQHNFLRGLPHQHCSIAEIQHALGISQSLFNTILSLQSAQDETIATDGSDRGIALSVVSEKDPTEYNISVNVFVSRKRISLTLRHFDETISSAMAENVMGTFQHIIHLIANNYHQPIGELDMMSARDNIQIGHWNQDQWPMVNDCIHELIHRRAVIQPDESAVEAWDGHLTYKELDGISSKLALHLASHAIGPNTLVPICFPKSCWMVVSQLAILKAGGACVAFDPEHPPSRREEMLRQCKAPVALVSQENIPLFEMFVSTVISIGPSFLDTLRDDPPTITASLAISPENPAFVVFTSGSTGKPKGIVVEHRALCSSIQAYGSVMKYAPGARVLQFAAYTFDVSIGETFGCLVRGGTLCIPSNDERLNDLTGVINRFKINALYLTPSVASILQPSDIPGVHTLGLGGEAVRKENIDLWAEHINLVNIYGPAECSVWCTALSPILPSVSPLNIGYGLGARTWITEIDNPSNLCVIGTVGELLIEGPVVARGYLNDEIKTNAVFIQPPAWLMKHDPSVAEHPRKVYRTGDLARYNSDGSVHFMGRRDHQVKLNGQRIELGEIDNALLLHRDIQNAVTLAPKAGPFKGKLVALVLLENQPFCSVTEGDAGLKFLHDENGEYFPTIVSNVRLFISSILPSYMVPSTWITVKSFPLSTNGKLDRSSIMSHINSLPSSYLNEAMDSDTNGDSLPRNDTEDIIRTIMSSVLNTGPANILMGRGFLAQGGDSITAMQVSSRCRAQGILVPVKVVLKSKTIRQIAAEAVIRQDTPGVIDFQEPVLLFPFSLLPGMNESALDDMAKKAGYQGLVDIEDAYPCSPMQEGILISQAQAPETYRFYVVCEVYCSSPTSRVSTGNLQVAWTRVVARHSSLRTFFVEGLSREYLYTQVVLKKHTPRIEIVGDFDSLSRQPHNKPLDHNELIPAHRMTICEDKEKIYFNLEINHTLIDGTSMGIILRDLRAAYSHGLQPGPLYRDYVALSLNHPKETTLLFWSKYLEGTKPTFFPRLHDGDSRMKELRTVNIPVSGSTMIDLQAFSRENGITMANIFQTVWAILLRVYTGESDVVFGYLSSGREIDGLDMENAVGAFITMLACRVNADDSSTLLSLAQNINEDFVNSLPYQRTSLGEMQHALGLASERLFNTILSLQRPMVQQNSTGHIAIQCLGGSDPTEYDLAVSITADDSAIDIDISYWSTIMSEKQAELLTSTFTTILSAFLKYPATKLHCVDALGNKQTEYLFSINGNGAVPYSVHDCIHSRFSSQVALYPKSPAVCSADMSLSYIQVEELSSKLAALLISLDVCPERVVALCFDKTPWAIVSMLAVLKAGGAYTSISPAHPARHIDNIIHQTKSRIVLTGSESYSNKIRHMVDHVILVDPSLLFNLPVAKPGVISLASPDNVAMINFTSGSTGKPKGIMVLHKGVCSLIDHNADLGINNESRVLQFSAFTFDTSNAEIFLTLCTGGCVCLPSDYDRLNDLAGAINRLGVTHAFLTPSVAGFLSPEAMPSLQMLALVGEAVTSDLVQLWQKPVRLINSYGPAECTIMSSFSVLHEGLHPSNIGKARGCILWVTNPMNSQYLVPAGCVGELLVEGPIVSKGYISPELTLEVFIDPPKWRGVIANGSRFYKTGDLARQMPDGSLVYVGRKDSQIKLNGQRVEMAEIEKEISSYSSVQHSVVLFPNYGPCSKKLVVVIGFKDISHTQPQSSEMIMLNDDESANQAYAIRDRMTTLLPSYMVPTVWIVCSNLPLTISRKIDRRKISQWVESLNDAFTERVAEEKNDVMGNASSPSSTILQRLQAIISRVLNISNSRVLSNRSFLNIGGDSITAMQLVVMCRNEGLKISFKDVMRSSTISKMVHSVEIINHPSLHEEELLEVSFGLSPIQQLYFEEISQGATEISANQFNQSFLLQLVRHVPVETLKGGIEVIVERHSMLRARFRKSSDGRWTQVITRPGKTVYRFREHTVSAREEALSLATAAQRQLDIQAGPVFAVEYFNIAGEDPLIFFVAHHLVIDLVSWRIIFQELEDHALGDTSIPPNEPFSFQKWQKLQADYASKHLTAKSSINYFVPRANYEYWGMDGVENIQGDTIQLAASLNAEETQLLVNSCHQAMRTEPLDVFITAILVSFIKTFDREPPAIFNEGHGRQPWTPDIDLSDSVGWFTTIFPLSIPIGPSDTLSDIVRRVKDQRKELPANGWSYFTSKYLNPDGAKRFRDHMPVEILFNYLGLYQGLEREDGIFQLQPFNDGDVGKCVKRYSLFDINAYIVNGRANFTFSFNRKMKHTELIAEWLKNFTQSLKTIPQELVSTDFTLTRSDYPLLQISSYSTLDALLTQKLPQLGFSIADFEDIYSCSPLQEGMLLSQARDEGTYLYSAIMRVKSTNGNPTDAQKLALAWQQVVNRHSILRTVFLAGISERPFDQAVLHSYDTRSSILVCDSPDHAIATLCALGILSVKEGCPPHRMTIAKSRDGVAYFKLEISHALMDGTSMAVLVNDIARAYNDDFSSTPAMPYSDYIAHIQAQPTEDALSFWEAYLDKVMPCHFPPLLDPMEGLSAMNDIEVKTPSVSEMRQFCRQNDVTLANVVRLAWALVLSAYTGEDQVCFGYLTAGREIPLPKIESSVGPLINMLICTIDIAEISKKTVLCELQDLQDEYFKALPFQHTSLAEIQHHMGLTGRSLFNSVVSVQRRDVGNTVLGDMQIEYISGLDPTEYDITVNVTDTNHGLQIGISYSASCLSPGYAANVSSALSAALFYIVSNPLSPAGSVNLFDEYHNQQVQKWNTVVPPPVYDCIHSLIEINTKSNPDAIAIDSWDATFTYSDLDKRGTQLSHVLISMGVRSSDMIPICFTKSSYAIVAMLGILKAGAAFIPLDPEYPKSRLATIINQSGSRLALTSPETSNIIASLTQDIVLVSSCSDWWAEEVPYDYTCPKIYPTDVAYVLFTSGSTGIPKGVVIEHSAVCTSSFYHGREIGCSSKTRMFQFSAYTFDACILEIFTTLIYGGCVCVPSEAERMNDIAGAVNRLNCNTTFLTPSVIRIIRPEQVPSLETVILGGEPLDKNSVEVWAGHCRLMNGYGPTETCVFCIMKTFYGPREHHDVLGHSVGSVSWVVRPRNHEQLAPVGAVGELLVQGGTLARCYLNDKIKTDHSFFEKPSFASAPDNQMCGRFYRTGDLARYNVDGSIIFLGRKDTQVKLRGQRIELSEVEYQVKKLIPFTSQVAVEIVMLRGAKDQALLTAFICDSADTTRTLPLLSNMTQSFKIQVDRLKKLLSRVLPHYMQPSIYVPTNWMPTTTARKLDRKLLRESVAALSEDELDRYSLDDNRRPPSSHTEKRLQQNWSEVLNLSVRKIRADDQFFEIGGDSISAMRLAAITSQNMRVSVADIFSYPVLSSLAAIIDSRSSEVEQREIKLEPFELLAQGEDASTMLSTIANQYGIPPGLIEDAYPPTPLQEGMVTHTFLNPTAYILRQVVRIKPSTDIARFRAAWETVSEKNPILRTRFVRPSNGETVQIVVKNSIEWRNAETLQQYLELDQSENVAYGTPLIRYAITDDYHFILTVHHSLYDGWSLPLLLRQVRSIYENGICPDIPGFNLFIKYLQNTNLKSTKTFWEAQLAGQRPATFPMITVPGYRPAVQHIVKHRLALPKLVNSEFLKSTILRAAWAFVLSVYSDSQDVVFGMTLSGRNSPVAGIEKIIGPIITTVPVRIVLNPTETLSEFLSHVQQQATEMIPHEHFGVQNISMLSAECSHATQFQNLLVIQPISETTSTDALLPGCNEVDLPLKCFDSYPLVVECHVSDDTVQIEARYDRCLLSCWQVENMMSHLGQLSKIFADNSNYHLQIMEIVMFGERDRQQVLEWNRIYPETVESTVPLVFAQQVKERPSNIAIDAWDGQLTYSELNDVSDVLAQHLTYLGVVPELLVPLCFDKSLWAVVAQMAVMKAGGACVNLDPSHPQGRLETIVKDSQTSVILCAPHYSGILGSSTPQNEVVVTEDLIHKLAGSPDSSIEPSPPSPANAAYVLFTSGSTGKPKGIVIEHRSLCSSSKAHGIRWGIGAETRVLQFAAYTFDVSCADIFTTLQRGGCICIPSEHDRLNALPDAINRFRCDWAFLTPTVASLLPPDSVPSLKRLVLGGEASTWEIINRWYNILELIVCYGPAECSIYCSGAPPATATSDPANLGSAIGALYWVANPNDHNQLTPLGCVGELLLEGPTIARGYLHDIERTEQAFVSNPSWAPPFTPGASRRFYRTGDLVRYNSDGTIRFFGRKDTQVKVRGQRVELGEIEHAISTSMNSITHATVDSILDATTGRQTVVAFLHFNNASGRAEIMEMTEDLRHRLIELRKALRESLPSYMIPSLYLPLARVPLTMNGKVDRRQLRGLVNSLTTADIANFSLIGDTSHVQPTTEEEFKLRELWSRALHVEVDTIGATDHFIHSGGDSIVAMRLTSLARAEGISLTVQQIFETPILSDMASLIMVYPSSRDIKHPVDTIYEQFSLLPGPPEEDMLSIVAEDVKTSVNNIADILPATDFQSSAIAHSMLKTRGLLNYIYLEGKGEIPWNQDIIQEKWFDFTSKHQILRTVFVFYQSKLYQIILKQVLEGISWHRTDDDIDSFCRDLYQRDIQSDRDLSDPLTKLMVVGNNERHRLILRLSHAQYDGISLPLIWQSLQTAFSGKTCPPEIPFANYISTIISQQEVTNSMAYWKALLADSKMTNVVEQSRPYYQNTYDLHTRRSITIPSQLSLSNQGITFATALKAAWAIFLASLSETTDIIFGHVTSGRTVPGNGIERVIGPCLNIIPVRAQMDTTTTALDLLQQLQSQHVASMAHETTGMRDIVRHCSPWKPYTRFSTIVQHQNIDETATVLLDDQEYTVGDFCPAADESDIAIKTTPRSGNEVEVLLISSSLSVGELAADRISSILCDTIHRLYTSEATDLLVTELIAHGQSLPPLSKCCTGTSQYTTLQSSFQSRSDEMLLTIQTDWRSALERPDLLIDWDSDFFDAGGDLVSVILLATTWNRQSYKVTPEQLLFNSRASEMAQVLFQSD
ncbi:hypothetical protein H103_00368 [Trichophyton rubrum CBS 288.86]|uniref:Carrier domain-containing protein n=1 Tax=Trichophyton rubrum CBS 288.86 TaxID=1215330 RepID=A0A022WGX8_TRIRU|nr:hypothetical protein H100_00370 [Trichophyton rubrum MR850]EZF57338.1 hypothetical protein H103_00368 [Trichophyton rubrum CBS 288.86]EZF67915.1 hypothetical protein H104_00369 [Trichophyton rubrum CBS 289.86]EZF89273.1 hypothetical protein H110_00372 [Trichophyton rubrum MR1448]EZG21663.1 hypothetical protein H107_00406 [Trichophyton rubrum CBS 202.88]